MTSLLTGGRLVLSGTSVIIVDSSLIAITIGILTLLAAATAAWFQSKRRKHRPAGQRVSYNLVTLSAAAILTVYGTGFHRTRAAADAFAARAAARRRPSARLVTAALIAPPRPSSQPATPPPPLAATATPAPSAPLPKPKDDHPQPSSSPVQPIASTPAPTTAPQPEPAAAAPTPAPVTVVAAHVPDPPADTPAPNLTPKVNYRDGTYTGWGRSAHGDIQASVVVQNGKIASTEISKCQTAYSCSWIAALPWQVVARQDPNIDCVTGASDSSYAFQDAVTTALFRAQGGG